MATGARLHTGRCKSARQNFSKLLLPDLRTTSSLPLKQPLYIYDGASTQVGSKVSISRQGHINVGRLSRPDVYWDDVTPPMLAGVTILSVSDGWVHYGTGRNDKFRNPRSAGGFVINSTELRAINFSMEALDRPAVQPRRGGRRAAVLSAPLPKRYRMHPEIDAMIRARCW